MISEPAAHHSVGTTHLQFGSRRGARPEATRCRGLGGRAAGRWIAGAGARHGLELAPFRWIRKLLPLSCGGSAFRGKPAPTSP